MTCPHASNAGLPPRLKLLIVELAGTAMMAGGIYALFEARSLGYPVLVVPTAVALVRFGTDLLLRPGARRRVPKLDRLVLTVLDRRRSPPTL